MSRHFCVFIMAIAIVISTPLLGITDVSIAPANPTTQDIITAQITTVFPTPCYELVDIYTNILGNTVVVDMYWESFGGQCAQVITSFSEETSLGILSEGNYTLIVQVYIDGELVDGGDIVFTVSELSVPFWWEDIITDVSITPSNPTTQDIITIHISGQFHTSGYKLVNMTTNISGNTVTVNMYWDSPSGNVLPVFTSYTKEASLGILLAGNYTVVANAYVDGQMVDGNEAGFTVSDSSGTACGDITNIEIMPTNPTTQDIITAEITTEFPTPCYELGDIDIDISENTVAVDMYWDSISGQCIQVITPITEEVTLEPLSEGPYSIVVNVYVDGNPCDSDTEGFVVSDLSGAACGNITNIEIVPANPTTQDVITADITTEFPTPCYELLTYNTDISGNIVTVNMYWQSVDGQCIQVITPITKEVTLDALSAGQYTIIVNAYVDGNPCDSASEGFTVSGSSGTSWGDITDVKITPSNPTSLDLISAQVTTVFPTPCYEFEDYDVDMLGNNVVVVDMYWNSLGDQCVHVIAEFTEETDIGLLAPGQYTLVVNAYVDGQKVDDHEIAFTVSDLTPIWGGWSIDSLTISPVNPTTSELVTITVTGTQPPVGCYNLEDVRVSRLGGNAIWIEIHAEQTDFCIPELPDTFSVSEDVGPLPSGIYIVSVQLYFNGIVQDLSSTFFQVSN